MPVFTNKYPAEEVYLERDSETLIDLMNKRFKKASFFSDSLFKSHWFRTNAELIRWAFKDQNKKVTYDILKEKIAARNITALAMRDFLQKEVHPYQRKYFYLASELLGTITNRKVNEDVEKKHLELYFELLFCLYNGRMSRFREIVYTKQSMSAIKDYFNHHIFSFDGIASAAGKNVQNDFHEPYVRYSSLPAQAGIYMSNIHEVSYKIDILERFILGNEYFDTWSKGKLEITIEEFLQSGYDTDQANKPVYKEYLLAYEKFKDATKYRKLSKSAALEKFPEASLPADSTLKHLESRWNDYQLRTVK